MAVPTGIILTRRRCPELPLGRALDLVAPVLMAPWAMGRLLGPSSMVAGGGHPTHQWFGLYYAGQAGRRLPVPIFQAPEDFAVFLVLIAIERRLDRWPDGTPPGIPPGDVLGTAMVLWGIERSLDEHLWLGEDGRLGSTSSSWPASSSWSAARHPRAHAGPLVGLARGRTIRRTTARRWKGWTNRPEPDAGYSLGGCDRPRPRAGASPCRSMASASPPRKIHPASHQGRISGRCRSDLRGASHWPSRVFLSFPLVVHVPTRLSIGELRSLPAPRRGAQARNCSAPVVVDPRMAGRDRFPALSRPLPLVPIPRDGRR